MALRNAPGGWTTGKIGMVSTHIMTRQYSTFGMACFAALVLLACLPVPAAAQQYYPEQDTTYYEDEYYDEYSEDEFYEGEYYEEDYGEGEEGFFGEEDYYYEEEGEYYEEGDEYYDEEGFDETFEEDFLDELEPEEGVEYLDLADDQAGEVELQEIERPQVKEPRPKRGYTAKVSAASPWLAGMGFDALWYSYVDARFALDLPRKKDGGRLGRLAPAYTLEASTFSFINNHPRGGRFRGVALQALIRLPIGPLEVLAGGGMYASGINVRGGMVFGASYTVPFIRFIAITFESRLTFVQNATAAGSAYWLDVGGSIGYPF